jgi:hypothetical protein
MTCSMLWRPLPLSKLLLGNLHQAEWLTIGCTLGTDSDSHISLNMLNMNQTTGQNIPNRPPSSVLEVLPYDHDSRGQHAFMLCLKV